ncbi:transposase [Enterococcus casseliflavus]|uniref:IS3 family transposase n=1 Tax=Enterococcus casseliflavus TaxID=37734 RepID=UPI001AD628E6|nr:transposase [Enterococcus casseliflavus]MBO6375464.1 transposase [Enterococcus casseliflavus]
MSIISIEINLLTTTQIKNNYLKQKIANIFFENKQRYGTKKIYHVLRRENISVSLKHVQKLMRQLNLRSITIRKYKP